MDSSTTPLKKPGGLAIQLVHAMTDQIRSGRLKAGDKLPTEAAIMKDFGVSRTVVREAISRLQASGWVDTRHGIGTFVLQQSEHPSFRISAEHMGTLREVIALLEFRISVETEAAALPLCDGGLKTCQNSSPHCSPSTAPLKRDEMRWLLTTNSIRKLPAPPKITTLPT